MFCPNCGYSLNGERFCPQCGANLNQLTPLVQLVETPAPEPATTTPAAPSPAAATAAPAPTAQQASTSSKKKIGIGIGIGVLIAAAITGGVLLAQNASTSSSSSQSSASAEQEASPAAESALAQEDLEGYWTSPTDGGYAQIHFASDDYAYVTIETNGSFFIYPTTYSLDGSDINLDACEELMEAMGTPISAELTSDETITLTVDGEEKVLTYDDSPRSGENKFETGIEENYMGTHKYKSDQVSVNADGTWSYGKTEGIWFVVYDNSGTAAVLADAQNKEFVFMISGSEIIDMRK